MSTQSLEMDQYCGICDTLTGQACSQGNVSRHVGRADSTRGLTASELVKDYRLTESKKRARRVLR